MYAQYYRNVVDRLFIFGSDISEAVKRLAQVRNT
jgi:hypothetical protein